MKKIILIFVIEILLLSGIGGAYSNSNEQIKIVQEEMMIDYDNVIDERQPVKTLPKNLILGEGEINASSFNQCNFDYEYISRDKIMQIASGFTNHTWFPTHENIYHGVYMGIGVDTPDRDTYMHWPDSYGWKANQTAHSLPYQWGGFSSIAGYNLSNPQDFDEQYTGTGSYQGIIHFAGDINTTGYCVRACGLDCSGFVSRCWNLPNKHGTYTFSPIVSPIRLEELKKGDILNIPYYHVILFKEFVDQEKTMIRIIECGGSAPNVNEYVYNITSISNDNFSITLDGYPPSRIYGLYRYEFIENAPSTPSLEGPNVGIAGNEYNYTCVSTDPERDKVSYCVDWGDGTEFEWFGPFNSSENINISHVWEEKGKYIIYVKAKDIHDIESGWTSLGIRMPKTRNLMHIELNEIRTPLFHFLLKFL